jgi:hypothetical protein
MQLRKGIMGSEKRYKIAGFPFVQKVLTYPEFEEAVRMSGGFLDDVKGLTGFGAVLDKLISSGVVRDLVKLVIKPYERTILHRLYYRAKRAITKKDLGSPIDLMNIDEVAEVVRDFFTINTSSLSSLMLIGNQSGLFPGPTQQERVSAPKR